MNDIALAKAQLRSKILSDRSGRVASESENQALTDNLLELVSKGESKSVAIYLSFGSEPSTTAAIQVLLNPGCEVLVPKVLDDERLGWYRWDGTSSTQSPHGMIEPDSKALDELRLDRADLVLIPALAVSRDGSRLGRGKGYFDRALLGCNGARVYAVCFENEFLVSLPVEDHDQRVSGVVTEVAIHELN